MKPHCFNRGCLLICLLAGTGALAQTNSVPNPQDYAKFITDRNIFDPSRQPHSYGSYYTHRTSSHTRAAQTIQFVGTMSYEKGLFAFFSGSSSDLSKVLPAGGKVAGYTLSKITRTNITLLSTNKQEFTLNVGDALRRESGKWVITGAADLPAETATISPDSSSGTNNATSSTPAAPATAPSTSEPNDVLKRLMQLREKENQ